MSDPRAIPVNVKCEDLHVTHCFDAVLYHRAFGAVVDVPLKRDIQRSQRMTVVADEWRYDVVEVRTVNRRTLRLRLALSAPV